MADEPGPIVSIERAWRGLMDAMGVRNYRTIRRNQVYLRTIRAMRRRG